MNVSLVSLSESFQNQWGMEWNTHLPRAKALLKDFILKVPGMKIVKKMSSNLVIFYGANALKWLTEHVKSVINFI